jgi:hypothetical protein
MMLDCSSLCTILCVLALGVYIAVVQIIVNRILPEDRTSVDTHEEQHSAPSYSVELKRQHDWALLSNCAVVRDEKEP